MMFQFLIGTVLPNLEISKQTEENGNISFNSL